MIRSKDYEGVRQYLIGYEISGQVFYWCAAYYWDGLLIDAGCPFCAQELVDELKDEPLDLVINTHYHEDHIGANAILVKERGVELFAPEKSLKLLAEGYFLDPYREMIWGHPQPSFATALGGEVEAPGRTLQVIPTPGHSPDHVCFWEPETGFAFVGDAWIAERPKTARREERYPQTLESLRRLRDLEPKVLFTGLGAIVEQATPVLERTIAYLEGMREEIFALHAQGLLADKIVKELFGRESSLAAYTQGKMSYENFVNSFILHS